MAEDEMRHCHTLAIVLNARKGSPIFNDLYPSDDNLENM